MDRFRAGRLTVAAVAAVLVGSALGACGGGDDETVSGTPVTGATSETSEPGSGVTGQSGNGPASAGDRRPDAPDSGISDRPGGPDPGDGEQGGGSGGISPPAKPSPVR
jgi:hypothetical protein